MRRLLFALCVLAVPASAKAVVLAPNTTVPGAALAVNPIPGVTLSLVSPVLNQTLASSPVPSSFTATINYAVYRETAGAGASGKLDFVFQLTNSGMSADAIAHAIASNFTGYNTDVFYSTATVLLGASGTNGFVDGTVAPTAASRSSNGKNIDFTFSPPTSIGPTETTKVLVIRTDANSYRKGNVHVQDDGSVDFNGFAPAPEPSSIILLSGICAGLGLVVVYRRFFQGAATLAGAVNA